ncbi:hypothetical protein HWV62_21675 [Athelia sp. TMB]|nr:hypothetical protein HWV62_21675 [Athelia sp. TMB]
MLPLAALPLLWALRAHAYSFSITNTPQQCQNLTLSITGSGGTPPYTALVLPYGASPLPNNTEVRRIQDETFDGTSASFLLAYPSNSQFVVVVSDATGFGTGGTSTAAQVQTGSSDSSCYGTTQVAPVLPFSTVPENQLVQCSPIRIWWTASEAQGTPQFYGIIPGGESFHIPEPALTTVTAEGTGFNWSVPVRAGTTVILTGGDNRGIGVSGSITQNVQEGISGTDNSCLNATSPSSTPGTPAGGMYPTGSNGAGASKTGSQTGSASATNTSAAAGGGSKSKTNIGAIVGGVIGGITALVVAGLLLLFFARRRRFHEKKGRRNTAHTVDLLHGDGDGEEHDMAEARGELPQFYQPEPFLVPDPTIAESSDGRRQSTQTSSGDALLGAHAHQSSVSTSTRKTPAGPSAMRPVNIIQHEDGGEEGDGDGEETIELPPAYTHIKKGTGSRANVAASEADVGH